MQCPDSSSQKRSRGWSSIPLIGATSPLLCVTPQGRHTPRVRMPQRASRVLAKRTRRRRPISSNGDILRPNCGGRCSRLYARNQMVSLAMHVLPNGATGDACVTEWCHRRCMRSLQPCVSSGPTLARRLRPRGAGNWSVEALQGGHTHTHTHTHTHIHTRIHTYTHTPPPS